MIELDIEDIKKRLDALEDKFKKQEKENKILHFKAENPAKYKVGQSIGEITILQDIVDIFYTGGSVERRYKYIIMGEIKNNAQHVGDIVISAEKYILNDSK